MPEVDSTSNSYIQDRQAAFVKSVKKNALLNDFENEFPSLKKSAPKFAGVDQIQMIIKHLLNIKLQCINIMLLKKMQQNI